MNKFVLKIKQNKYFLIFIVLFSYAQSVNLRIIDRNDIDFYTFTPDAAFGTLIQVCFLYLVLKFFIHLWEESNVFSLKKIIKIFAFSIITYILINQLFYLIVAIIFGNVQRNFKTEIVSLVVFQNLLDGFIYGSFLLAYKYYNHNLKAQKLLIKYNQVLAESKISQLKSQLNPHFLFNNLNVLDQLIEEDKVKASNFLNEFAEIYRYVLQTSDKKTIELNQELIFVQQYFNLIKHKYGNAYKLKINNINTDSNLGFIVPLTLQLLVENAIQHNLGTEKKPIEITIDVSNSVVVTNNLSLIKKAKTASGRGLNNLNKQYQLLTSKSIITEQTLNNFMVIVPII